MTDRTYPYTAWTLQPSFKPVKVKIVGPYGNGRFWDRSDAGKDFAIESLFATKADAIASGRSRLADQQTLLDKKAANIAKRYTALDKAEASA
jgi:hypothetical protein